jgi:predicted transcriptional regulator
MTLLECITELGMTPDEFAHSISVPTATIDALIRGDDVPSPKIMLVRQSLQAEGLYWDGK